MNAERVNSLVEASDACCTPSEWPQERLQLPGSLDQAAGLAREMAARVRAIVLPDGDRCVPLAELDEVLGIARVDLVQRKLVAARNSLQAICSPRPGNRFRATVDPEPPGGWAGVEPQLRSDLERHRRRFLACHELAHTFFYDRSGDKPTRRMRATVEEEQFCDHFARELLVPPAAVRDLPPAPASLRWIQQRFDVSLELAARAYHGSRKGSPFVALLVRSPNSETELWWAIQWQSHVEPLADRWWKSSVLAAAVENGQVTGSLPAEPPVGEIPIDAEYMPERRQLLLVGEAATGETAPRRRGPLGQVAQQPQRS